MKDPSIRGGTKFGQGSIFYYLGDGVDIRLSREHRVAKELSENEKLHKEREHLKKTYKKLYDSIKLSCVHAKQQCDSLISNLNSKSMENAYLKTQIQEKVFANTTLKNELRKLKGNTVIDNVASKPHATNISPGMFKLNLESLALNVLKNKDAYIKYIKHSREHADILKKIVKSARELSPLYSNLDSALAVTPKNKDKKIRFADPVISSSNTQKHADSHTPKDSNQTLLHSTGVIGSTGASGSKPTGNTKNNRISQSSSSNKTNNVKDPSRSVKSRKNKKNHVAKTECNAYVMQSVLNANSKSVCAIFNECFFDANHDKCVLDYVHDVNVLSKSKPAKRKNKKHIWNPTSKVYTEIGYKWKPTGHTFTIVKNKCPLTRFTSTKIVPLKKITTKSVVTPTSGIMVYSRRPKAPKSVIQIVLCYLDSGCSKHVIGNRSQLTNFVNKFLGTIKFGNDQIAKIMSYSDYQIGNVTISRVYYVEGLRHNLFFVGLFCDSDLENDVVERRNHTLVEAARTMLIYAKAPLFLWAEEVATTCYTQDRSLIRLHHGKTPYELLHDRKLDLSYLHVFGALCYPTNDSEDLGKLKAKADVGIFSGYAPAKKAYWIYNRCTRRIMETIHVDFDELTTMDSEQSSSGPALHEMTPGILSSGLVPQPPSLTPFVLPIRDDWDTLLQRLFDEYFHPPPCVDHPVPEVAAPVPVFSTGSPSSTSVDQDAPSPSTSQTPQASPSYVIAPGAEEADHDIEVVVIPNNVHSVIQLPEHISKWTKDHSIDNSYKEALTGSCWIEVMQEELNEFERLEVQRIENEAETVIFGLADMPILGKRWQAVCQEADQVTTAGQSERDTCPKRMIQGVSGVCQSELRHVQCVPMIGNKCSSRLLDLKALEGHVLSKCVGHSWYYSKIEGFKAVK
ncbi:retrovirus-related pol polyprotein from transposon TNT 1-94 [Tanacetum coccineum]